MNVELKKIKRTVYIVAIFLVLALVLAIWFFSRSLVTIDVTPRTAGIWLDGQPVKVVAGSASINTSIGNHQLKIAADNYIGENDAITLNRGFNKKMIINLTQTPRPVQINSAGVLLMKGSDFNDGYYLSGSTIYKTKVGLDENGSVSVSENRPITGAVVNDVREIIWSPDKALALLRHSGSVSLFDFMKYDFVHQTDTPWGGNDIGSIAWSPDNSKIAYYYAPSTGEKSLIFANITNANIERMENFAQLGIDNPLLRWSPDSEWLLIIPRNKNAADNKIYLYNVYSRQLKTITDGNQLDAVFSPDSNHILYNSSGTLSVPSATLSSGGGTLPELNLMDKDGSNKVDLKIKANLSTVVWTKDAKNIIVATVDPSTNLPTIFRFDTDKAALNGFSISNLGNVSIQSIAFSDDGKLLLYETNNAVYALKVD